jgi:hypothetical protein
MKEDLMTIMGLIYNARIEIEIRVEELGKNDSVTCIILMFSIIFFYYFELFFKVFVRRNIKYIK